MPAISPITKSNNVTKIKTIEVCWIISQWKLQFNYDVSYLFKELITIELYRCNDTGYLFFTPNIIGDSKLYEHLQSNYSYYMAWKWEYQIALNYLRQDTKLLEIGCGEGHFLNKIGKEYKIKVAGIETNLHAASKAREKGLTIYDELIVIHSLNNSIKYDIICCFQVLEHIADVKSFLEECLAILKKGGILLLSVPNNNSFISEFDHLLNIPPHHVGFWDENSLKRIASFFKMTFEALYKEPLQEYHEDFFKSTVYKKIFGKIYTNRISGKLLRMFLLKPFFDKHIKYFTKWIIGHTIVVIYRKT